ncbi:MAG: TldD/PmbA family protein [Clostridia bacterium]|jgi:PmbA protein|nr:TldD/PmbA family protein [Clostridia bacterium]
MDLMEFKKLLFSKAEENGLEEYELFYSKGENFSINVYEGDIDKYSVSSSMGLGFRALVDGKMGYSYTESLDEESVEFLVGSVIDNARNIDSEEKENINNLPQDYSKLETFNKSLEKVAAGEKIDLALQLEKEAKNASDKVASIRYCSLGTYTEEKGIFNCHGIEAIHKNNFLFAAVTPIVKEGEKAYDNMSYIIAKDIEEVNPALLARTAVKEALSRIGGEAVPSGKYKVLLRNDVAAEILSTFSGAFSAENVHKGLSLLKGKENTIIGSENLTLVDNPLLVDGLASCPFDGEGVATYKKSIIEKGRLRTFLHNLKTAQLFGLKTTGNASRPSYASRIGVAPTNFYIEAGKASYEELLEELKEGLLITDLAGTHSGANAITGDFSLAAKGFYISQGKVVKAVEQITVSGNFFQLLKDILAIGKDLKFTLPSASSHYGSPSLLIKELAVAGK